MMSKEHLDELREAFDYEHPVNELIEEIERLQQLAEYWNSETRQHMRDDNSRLEKERDRYRAALEEIRTHYTRQRDDGITEEDMAAMIASEALKVKP